MQAEMFSDEANPLFNPLPPATDLRLSTLVLQCGGIHYYPLE